MRNAENNEIDLLLRDLAQRESAESARRANARTEQRDEPGDHLDPDELSSFAEGVLPIATRSFYAAHLADCSRCRKIVAQLAMASGAGVRPVATEPSKSKLWTYIASFFTPGVMRYAVPALSLVILAAIGLIWIRQTRRSEFVARNNQSASEPEAGRYGTNQPGLTEGQTKQDSAARDTKASNATAKAGASSTENERSQTKNETAATSATEKAQKGTEPAESRIVAVPPSVALDANAPAPAKPVREVAEESKREEFAKERQVPAAPAGAVAQSEDERRNRRDKDDRAANKKAETTTTADTVSVASGRRAMTTTGAAQSTEKSDTRTVGGRRFRRVGNAWVDTAYDSSAHMTTVTRGSEQYRALVGDEPSLRAISEQLDGEVIVVWKGRAYRIR